VLSDDAHAIDHVGTNYRKVIFVLRDAGIDTLHYFSRRGSDGTLHLTGISLFDLEDQQSLAEN
jgi:hypothetical protein